MNAQFLPCGDTGLSVQFGEGVDRSLSARVIRIKRKIDAARIRGVVETVPSYRAVMIHYDPLAIGQASLIEEIEPLLEGADDTAAYGIRWRIPACYDPRFGPDLEDVASWAGLTVPDVVDIHTSTTHYVYMIGFAPGQPHMGDLPPELDLPRRKDPRARIEKGSIVTATGLTIIYPFANACGWHVIGRSPVSVFDATKDPPVLLRPGDLVTFFPVSLEEFHEIARRLDAGLYRVEHEDQP